MKIYLNTDTGWKLFDATLEELLPELEKRNIAIHSSAEVGEGAEVGAWAKVGEGAKVGARAEVGAWAKVGEDCVIVYCVYIIGSKHTVNYWGKKEGVQKIAIGCHVHSFQEWLDNFQTIGKENGYTESQIAEYKAYIDVVIAVHSKNDW